jgi:hypothetical protein
MRKPDHRAETEEQAAQSRLSVGAGGQRGRGLTEDGHTGGPAVGGGGQQRLDAVDLVDLAGLVGYRGLAASG